MKKYLEFITENVSFVTIKKAFREMFPDKETLNDKLIEYANEYYEETDGGENRFDADGIEWEPEKVIV